MPIRLLPSHATTRVYPFARTQSSIRWYRGISCDPKPRAEHIERVDAAVDSTRECIAGGLSRLITDTMVGPRQPDIQVSEDAVDARQILVGNLGIAAEPEYRHAW